MTLSNALFWGWAGLFWQSPEKVPRAPSSRIPAILWYAAGVTLVASYTANLVTFLTGKNVLQVFHGIHWYFVVKKQIMPLDTFSHLRQAMYANGFTYGFARGSTTQKVTSSTKSTSYIIWWHCTVYHFNCTLTSLEQAELPYWSYLCHRYHCKAQFLSVGMLSSREIGVVSVRTVMQCHLWPPQLACLFADGW